MNQARVWLVHGSSGGNQWIWTSLLARRLRRATHVRVAQILQHGLLILAHSLRKVRIVQPLIPRRFRHVLQHAQLLLHYLLAVPRHLLPLRQHVVLDVVSLLGRHPPPIVFLNLLVRPLLRRHFIPLIELLPNLVLLLGRKILERAAILQHLVALLWRQRAHLIHPGPRRPDPRLLPRSQTRSPAIRRPVRITKIGSCRSMGHWGTVRARILIGWRPIGIACRSIAVRRGMIGVLIPR